jgi:hypothetical protein
MGAGGPAGSGPLIQFDPTLFAASQTIRLTSTLELANAIGPVVIQGPATNNVVINGEGSVGDLMVDTGVTATLSHLVITNGNGGGVNSDGTLTVADCVLSGNSTAHDGGGISNTGTLTVTGTTITNNTGSDDAGGVLSRMGTATVAGSLIAGNAGDSDGGGPRRSVRDRVGGRG